MEGIGKFARYVLLAALLAVGALIFSQEEPAPQVFSAEQARARLAPRSEGAKSTVSCVATADDKSFTGETQPRVRLSGTVWFDTDRWRGDVAWRVDAARGAWSINGSAKIPKGTVGSLQWSGSWWYWWGPFQRKASGGGMCRF